jgi:hypothetical protein
MKKSRTGSPAREALASPPVATAQVPLRLLEVLADTRTAFFGLCQPALARAHLQIGCGGRGRLGAEMVHGRLVEPDEVAGQLVAARGDSRCQRSRNQGPPRRLLCPPSLG